MPKTKTTKPHNVPTLAYEQENADKASGTLTVRFQSPVKVMDDRSGRRGIAILGTSVPRWMDGLEQPEIRNRSKWFRIVPEPYPRGIPGTLTIQTEIDRAIKMSISTFSIIMPDNEWSYCALALPPVYFIPEEVNRRMAVVLGERVPVTPENPAVYPAGWGKGALEYREPEPEEKEKPTPADLAALVNMVTVS